MSEELGTTCSRDVAVSVRTPPKAPRWTGRAVLENRREEAGRERREIERTNTIMIDNDLIADFDRLLDFNWFLLKGKEVEGAVSLPEIMAGCSTARPEYVSNIGIGRRDYPTYGN